MGVKLKLLKDSSVPHKPDRLWRCDVKKAFCPDSCAEVEKWRSAPWAHWAKQCVMFGRLSRWWNSAAMDLINTGGSWQNGVGLETSCWSSSGSYCSGSRTCSPLSPIQPVELVRTIKEFLGFVSSGGVKIFKPKSACFVPGLVCFIFLNINSFFSCFLCKCRLMWS